PVCVLPPCHSLFTPPFFFSLSGDPRALHSFPTRRSSDLYAEPAPARPRPGARPPRRYPIAGRAGNRNPRLPRDFCGWSRGGFTLDRKSTRLNSSHVKISYAVFCLKKKKQT